MNIAKTSSITAVSVIATLAVASIFGFQLSEITAEEDEDKGYTFGEDVAITAYFHFVEGDEMVPFQVFEQTGGWERAEPYTFELQKIVGETPLLHKRADESYKYRNSAVEKQTNNAEFTVSIILSNDADLKRVFDYRGCFVDTYNVDTIFDKEEGWNTSKGFAVVDVFEIQCEGYNPQNPTLVEMSTVTEKAAAKSSLAYQEEQRHLFGN